MFEKIYNWINEAASWNSKGNTLYNQGHYAEAIVCYDQALALDKKYKDAWNNKGLALYYQGHYAEAIVCYDQALALDKKYKAAWNNKGLALYYQGHYAEVIVCYDQALVLDKNDKAAWNNKGLALFHQGHYGKAIVCFDQVLALDKDYKETWNNKGLTLYVQDHYAKAIVCFDKAIALDKNHTYAWCNKALIFLLQEDLKSAQICLNTPALKHNKDIWHRAVKELYGFANTRQCNLFTLLDKHFKQPENSQNISSQLGIYERIGKYFIECNALAEAQSCLQRGFLLQPNNLGLHQLEKRLQAKQAPAPITLPLSTSLSPQKPVSKPYVEKSWHFDPETKAKRPAPDIIYELVEATEKDKRKVIQFYQHHPVPGYEMACVHVIYNADMNHEFALHMKKLQQRENNPAFKAKWPSGQENLQDSIELPEQIAWRSEIHQESLTLAKPYQDSDYPAVNLLPMWHGTKKAIVGSIFKTGYANLATTDAGFFGKGIYGAYEAEYSHRVYAKQDGVLILNWTAFFSAYPVIHKDQDMKKFMMKNDKGQYVSIGNYSNYDAHFIPVVPRNPDNPDEEVYCPTKPKEPHTYTELVVFQTAACLPRYLVELQPTLVKPMPSVSSSGYSGVFFPSAEQTEEEKKSTLPTNQKSLNYQ